jgi:hypothetical protein
MVPKKVNCRAAFSPGRLVLSLAAAALLLAAAPARAALQFDVFLGYDDLLPERSWFPITCEIHNDGPPFKAVIEVTAGEFGQGQTRRVALDLPTNTRKRIVIPVFATSPTWNVRLLDERGNVRAEESKRPTRMVRGDLPLVAALARTFSGVPVLPESKEWVSDSSKYPVARLQPELFPENPLALEGIDMLYVSSEKAVNLTIGQVNALMAWLQEGGHLVVGVEQLTDINATPWLRELLPMTLTSIVSAGAHDALQEWTRTAAMDAENVSSRSPLRKGAPALAANSGADDAQFGAAPMQVAVGSMREGAVLIGDESAPLAADGLRGRGRVTVLTFSPEREPFASWNNRMWFWSKLAGVSPAAYLNQSLPMRGLSSDGIFKAMIETKQVRKLPLGWLLALLAGYLVVIGPLDQYWLKKINRQMLTWVTFPCYVVLFSGLIYLIGFHLRAGELEWNELNVVDVLPDSQRAVLRGETYVSIYSPNNAHYELEGRQRFSVLRGEFGFSTGEERGRLSIDQTANNFSADTFVPVWTSQLFVSDWVEPAGLPLEMSAERRDGYWDLTIENKMDRALEGFRVILGGRVYEPGKVAPSEKKTFSFKTSQGMPVSQMTQSYGEHFRNAVEALNRSFGNNVNYIADPESAAMAASFLSYLNGGNARNWNNFSGPSTLDLSRFADNRYAILLAWEGDFSPSNLNRFTAKRTHRNTLLRLVVPVKT